MKSHASQSKPDAAVCGHNLPKISTNFEKDAVFL